MAATIKDIANETGLSLSTISKYLNNGRVREKNRVAIERAIVKFDFRPNEIARGLRSARTRTVGVLVPSFRSVFNGEIAAALEQHLSQFGYGMFMVDSGGSRESEKNMLDFLARKMVDGIIVHATYLKSEDFADIARRGIPVVLLDQNIEGLDADRVLVDNFCATKEATAFLRAKGHAKIGFVGGPCKQSFTAAERLRGYCSVQSGNAESDKYTRLGDYSVEHGYEATLALLKEGVTALLYSNHDLTLGGVYALNEKGVAIGEEISVIGFDDIYFSKLVKPKLAVISQPMDEIGEVASRLIVGRIENASLPYQTRILQTSFAANNSVKEVKQ